MRYYQFVMYLFTYKVIDVRWCWETGASPAVKDAWDAAAAEMEET